VEAILNELWDNLIFLFGRFNWLSIIDVILVTLVFYAIFRVLRETQAISLFRGILLLVALMSVLTSLDVLPAFSWLVQTSLPALLLAIPVIFAPEIRRTLERLGRAGIFQLAEKSSPEGQGAITAVVNAAVRLADRRHGALIVLQRLDVLDEYISTGVKMDARITVELLMQIFYPNTPLHDGAVIIEGHRLLAASCVMPLSASGVLTRSVDRQVGLRHRAAMGISEATDAVAVVVSEETGIISVVHGGRMIRRLDAERLENVLRAFFRPPTQQKGLKGLVQRIRPKSEPEVK
jgi:diadenylate cyclase